MRAITALSIASDAIRAAVIADPYTDSPTIKHFQALPLPVGAVVDGEVVDAEVVTGLLKTLCNASSSRVRTPYSFIRAVVWCSVRRTSPTCP